VFGDTKTGQRQGARGLCPCPYECSYHPAGLEAFAILLPLALPPTLPFPLSPLSPSLPFPPSPFLKSSPRIPACRQTGGLSFQPLALKPQAKAGVSILVLMEVPLQLSEDCNQEEICKGNKT